MTVAVTIGSNSVFTPSKKFVSGVLFVPHGPLLNLVFFVHVFKVGREGMVVELGEAGHGDTECWMFGDAGDKMRLSLNAGAHAVTRSYLYTSSKAV